MKKGSIIYCDFREELGLCYDLGRPIPSGRKKAVSAVRGWFTTRLGFSISKKLLKEDCIKVELNDNEEELFPHEIEWKQNIDVEDFIWIRDKFRPSSCEEIISTIDEISDVLEPNQNERPVELMKNFTNRTSFSDLHIIMDFLFENPHNRKVANLVRSLIQIMENGAIDEIPKWLEDMME